MSSIYKQLIFFVSIIILIPILFIPSFSTNIQQNNTNIDLSYSIEIGKSGFVWPSPGYTKITSYFGKRTSPTKYASSFHQGIDIGVPTGSNLVAVTDSIVTYTGFNGSAGYSIHLKSGNLEFYYHHVHPHFIVKVNDFVRAGQLIGQVGPKNVYGVKNNPYKDSNGNPTNGATTRASFTFYNKKRRPSRQSFKLFLRLSYISSSSSVISLLLQSCSQSWQSCPHSCVSSFQSNSITL